MDRFKQQINTRGIGPTPPSGVGDSAAIWLHRAQRETSSLAASVMRGDLTVMRAKEIQEKNEGLIEKDWKGDGIKVYFPSTDTTKIFNSMTDLLDYYHTTGGLIYKLDENGRKGNIPVVGEPAEEIFRRRLEMQREDTEAESEKLRQ